jgi:S-adenosylmethionine decarboxylase
MQEDKLYGIELILDMHECDIKTFTKENLDRFFIELCDLIDMKRHGVPMYWHDDSEVPHLKGISGVQFIETSNVVVHCIELMGLVLVNIFSCKEFDPEVAQKFTKEFFGAKHVDSKVIERR